MGSNPCARAITLSIVLTTAVAGRGAAAPRSALPGGIVIGPGSTLWLEGKSNVHDFESRSTTLAASFTRVPGTKLPTTAAQVEAVLRASGVQGLELTLPARSLHSKRDGLDKYLWQDLRADQFPSIGFHLSRYTVAPRAARSDTIELRAEGTLTVAGRARPVAVAGRAYRSPRGVWLEGTHGLLMTEYGIKPRRMMLGSLRVKDRIVVHFRLLLVPGGMKS